MEEATCRPKRERRGTAEPQPWVRPLRRASRGDLGVGCNARNRCVHTVGQGFFWETAMCGVLRKFRNSERDRPTSCNPYPNGCPVFTRMTSPVKSCGLYTGATVRGRLVPLEEVHLAEIQA